MGQILQPVVAQVAQLHVVRQAAGHHLDGGLGHHDLAAMRRGHDPRGAVDVEADVVPSDDGRAARVDADADAHLDVIGPGCRGQPTLQVDGRRDSVGRRRERDEEGVALRPHLHPAVLLECRPQHPAMRVEHVRVPLAQHREQGRRTLDVREDQGDVADRQSS